jgi:hypothetical protein
LGIGRECAIFLRSRVDFSTEVCFTIYSKET